MRKVKFDEIVVQEILDRYDKGECITNLNKEYHTTKVRDLLIENGRKVPESRKGQGGAKRKYTLNENYFEKLDSKDKAYFLGFIYADGFITKRSTGQNILGITLAEDEPLEKFKKYIGCNKPIGVYQKKGSYSNKSVEHKLALISNKLVSDVEKLGVIENKTLVLTFPELPTELVHHFIRGYFDGDGSVFLHNDPRPEYDNTYLGIDICGTKEFLEGLTHHLPFIEDEQCIYKELRKETNCWNIKFNSNIRSLELYHYMYRDCSDLYLTRKKDKFENFIKDKGSETIMINPNQKYKDLCYLEG